MLFSTLITFRSKDEVNGREVVKEIFVEETVRSLSTNLIEITRKLLEE